MKRFVFNASKILVAGLIAWGVISLARADEIYDWSNAAANNNAAPPDGFPENMNYSEVNDAARELMAVVKRYIEAVDGTNATTGTEPDYALSSGQSLSAGAAGRIHVWTAHASATGAVTLDVDSAGAKNVVDASGTPLGAGSLVQSGVYMTVETASNHRIIGALSTPAVSGPAASTDSAVARFDGTSGRTVQNSGVSIDDSNNVSGVAALTTSGNIELGSPSANTLTGSSGDVSIEGNVIYRAGGTDVPVADGGTGASTATGARTNLGLAIGSNVQAFDAQLSDVAGITPAKGSLIAGDGSNFAALGVGSNGQVLTADSGETAGLAWADSSASILTIKAYAQFDGSGTSPITPAASANVSSITTSSAGNFVINFTTNMSGTNYLVLDRASDGIDNCCHIQTLTRAVGSLTIEYERTINSNNADPADISIVIME